MPAMEDKPRSLAAALMAAPPAPATPEQASRVSALADSVRSFGEAMAPLALRAKEPDPPTPVELMWTVLEAALYSPIALHSDYNAQLYAFRSAGTQYDRYCPVCKVQTPWLVRVPTGIDGLRSYLGTFSYASFCKRCDNSVVHHMISIGRPKKEGESFRIADVQLIKLGQWPSLSDFHQNDLGPYEKVTTKEQRRDFTRAIQAAASGFTAGACTYLRRVLESIVEEALATKRQAGVTAEWEDGYRAARTNKRMEMLADQLPPFLLKNKRLYALLSEGLHKLSDDECQELFPNLRQAIELIFKGRYDMWQRRKHEEEISKFIARNDPNA